MTLVSRLAPESRRPLAATALAGAFLLAGLGLLTALGATWLERIAERDELAATRAALVERGRARDPRAARAERLFAADPWLDGATDVLAVNDLRRRLVALAQEAHVAIRSLGGDETVTLDPAAPPAVAMRLEAEAGTAEIQAFLYRLETETPFLIVRELVLRPLAGPDESVGARLAASLVVQGFHRGEAGR